MAKPRYDLTVVLCGQDLSFPIFNHSFHSINQCLKVASGFDDEVLLCEYEEYRNPHFEFDVLTPNGRIVNVTKIVREFYG